MKAAYRPIEPYGFEQIIIDDHENIPEGCTEIVPPVPNWKPKFDFEKNQWSELATEEEKKGSAVDDVTELEKLKRENEELKKAAEEQVIQMTDTQLAIAEVYEMLVPASKEAK
ncbi:hypothetical protein [Enterococcus durans]|uniref:hypothetical protein n=1 Tax=Enterococcus durans TaxID=53345 RepID=UPI000E053DC6|nr:hypothetical protein [Enterococcus durans]STP39315.1 cytochrome c-type biogenesis protein CcmE [Enterococcus durans]